MKHSLSLAVLLVFCIFGVWSHDFYSPPHPYMHYNQFMTGVPYGGMYGYHGYQGYGPSYGYGGYGNYFPRRKFKGHKRYHTYGRHGYGPAFYNPHVQIMGFRGYSG